jgi:3-deoxy-D-manno-octulosonate 8-phosphate phosphatase (KDO 8-P phosphatase)
MKEPVDDFTAKARSLTWLLLDVDGVLTDGRLYYGAEAEPWVAFDIKDGLAMKFAQRAGLKVGLLSGRRTRAFEARARALGLDCAILGREDKELAFTEFLATHHESSEHIAYIGDDLLDLPVLRRCGLSLAPADAVPEVRAVVARVLPARGGRGAVRAAVEAILGARDAWPPVR